jgi:hypothetical protein
MKRRPGTILERNMSDIESLRSDIESLQGQLGAILKDERQRKILRQRKIDVKDLEELDLEEYRQRETLRKGCVALWQKIAAQLEKNDLSEETRARLTNVLGELERFVEYGYSLSMYDDAARRLLLVLSEAARAMPNTSRKGKGPGRRGYSKEVKGSPCKIIALGDSTYRVNEGEPIKVTEREDLLLRSFLAKSPLTKTELEKATGIAGEDAVTVLRSLKGTEKRPAKYKGAFAASIRMPGARGRGGYHVSIQSDA